MVLLDLKAIVAIQEELEQMVCPAMQAHQDSWSVSMIPFVLCLKSERFEQYLTYSPAQMSGRIERVLAFWNSWNALERVLAFYASVSVVLAQ